MSIIKPLPSWAIINRFPAFYEGESLTSIEQVARVYAKMQELIESYNKYIEQVNAELMELETSTDKDLNCAIKTLINLTDSYISVVDLKLVRMDRTLAENYRAFTDNVLETISNMVQELKENGELDQAVLDAVDGMNTKFANAQAQLESYKTELDAKYDNTLSDLNEQFTQTRESIQTLHEMRMDQLKRQFAKLETDYQNATDSIEKAPAIGPFVDENEMEFTLNEMLSGMVAGQTKRFTFMVEKLGDISIGAWGWNCTLYKSSDGYGILKGESGYLGYACKIEKCLSNGVWQPAGWENPPLLNGVEYRTTEKWDGQPVYTKKKLLAYSMDNEVEGFNLPSGSQVIRHYARTAKFSLPRILGGSLIEDFAVRYDGAVSYFNGADVEPSDVTAQLWYTKA